MWLNSEYTWVVSVVLEYGFRKLPKSFDHRSDSAGRAPVSAECSVHPGTHSLREKIPTFLLCRLIIL